MLKLTKKNSEPQQFTVKDMPLNKLCRVIKWGLSPIYIGYVVLKATPNLLLLVDCGREEWWSNAVTLEPSDRFMVELLEKNDTLTIQ
jgi:hypothetical protein